MEIVRGFWDQSMSFIGRDVHQATSCSRFFTRQCDRTPSRFQVAFEHPA